VFLFLFKQELTDVSSLFACAHRHFRLLWMRGQVHDDERVIYWSTFGA